MSVVQRDPSVLGGTPTFVGTNVPASRLIKTLKEGGSVHDFVAENPAVTLDMAKRLLAEMNPDEDTLSPMTFEEEALRLLQDLTGDSESTFRPDQLEAVRMLVEQRQRVLLVQRTGWGKSAVYFIATKMLRDRGAGPTLLVSPLLALMRNQQEAARRMGIVAESINSSNREEWMEVIRKINADAVDILLISPERLANQQFTREVLPQAVGRTGLLVIDEVHCISDWGHDFRPDYRRIADVLRFMPAGLPILGSTATANKRVVGDVSEQLGADLIPARGSLARPGLKLHALKIPSQSKRMVWLVDVLPKLPGTGIIYCLTIDDTERVAGQLRAKGIDAVAYSSRTDDERRPEVEHRLMDNDLKAVVATSALGMGIDKPDLAFVIHFQSPSSPIAYYQQVGRAGRALPESWGILLSGSEDEEIQDYFIDNAFPEPWQAEQVVKYLEERSRMPGPDGRQYVTLYELMLRVDAKQRPLEQMLKILEIEGSAERDGGRWVRSLRAWNFDSERVESVTALRREEQQQMRDYISTSQCRMQLLCSYLDSTSDSDMQPCGMCDNCTGQRFNVPADSELLREAEDFIRSFATEIKPPDKSRIPLEFRLEPGRALARWGSSGWGVLIRQGKQEDDRFDRKLVEAAADLIENKWRPDPFPQWLAFVPSRRHPELVGTFARQLAEMLGIPCEDVIRKTRETEPQKFMQNTAQQYRNILEVFKVSRRVPAGPVLLVDDIVDSRWTLTVIGGLLRQAGSGPVYPFALADAQNRQP